MKIHRSDKKKILEILSLKSSYEVAKKILLFLGFLVFLEVIYLSNIYYSGKEVKEELHQQFNFLTGLPVLIPQIVRSVKNNLLINKDYISIEFNPKNYQKIMRYRDNALNEEVIDKKFKKYVNAEITFKEETKKVKIRLRGRS